MERALIVREENGVYYDEHSRPLQTMGDTNISIGQTVWTNGETIYGHQSAGETTPVIITEEAILPIPNIQSSTLYQLSSNGKLKPLLKNSSMACYVGDSTHAYGSKFGGATQQWFNILTGEYLGDFVPTDACIGEDGSLLTIEAGGGRYEDWDPQTNYVPYSYEGPIEGPVPEVNKKDNPQNCMQCVRIKSNSSVKSSADYCSDIIIRKNGKIVQVIPMKKYLDSITKSVDDLAKSIGDIDYEEEDTYFLINGEPVKDIKLPSKVIDGSLVSEYLKIYPNASYSGMIYYQANGEAHPAFVYDSDKIADDNVIKVKRKLWLDVDIFKSASFGIGKYSTVPRGVTQSIRLDHAGVIRGEAWPNSKFINPEKFKILPNYEFTGIKYSNEKHNLYILGLGNYGIHYQFKDDSDVMLMTYSASMDVDIRELYEKNKCSSYIETSNGNHYYPNSIQLSNGVIIVANKGLGESIEEVLLYDKGNLICTIQKTNSPISIEGQILLRWNYLVVNKISANVYAIGCTYENNNILGIIRNGKLEQIPEYFGFNRIFTLVPFRHGQKLKRQLKKLFAWPDIPDIPQDV